MNIYCPVRGLVASCVEYGCVGARCFVLYPRAITMTNHEAAGQLLELAKRDGGFFIGQYEWVPLATAQAMYDSFCAHVPVAEIDVPLTVGGKPVISRSRALYTREQESGNTLGDVPEDHSITPSGRASFNTETGREESQR